MKSKSKNEVIEKFITEFNLNFIMMLSDFLLVESPHFQNYKLSNYQIPIHEFSHP